MEIDSLEVMMGNTGNCAGLTAANIKVVRLQRPKDGAVSVKTFGLEQAEKVHAYHQSFPEYQETPLVSLDQLAKDNGVAGILVKDESYRFGLNAFKVLGGSYCIGRYISGQLGIPMEKLTYDRLTDPGVKEGLGDVTFVTATDGNHGRGIAWTAHRLKQKSVVYMPKGSAWERLQNIQVLGSNASMTDLNYDDAVRKAYDDSRKYGWVMVQDTAWEGYEDVPTWIMQGYTTMGYEIVCQMKERHLADPTHIILQAGVGAMAGAITAFFADVCGCGDDHPVVIIVEPDQADCIFRSAAANDGKVHLVSGEMNTMMAGLACGEPCTIAWEILHDYADFFVSMPDCVAVHGMRVLARPAGGDPKVVSGESGAAGLGFLMEVLRNPELKGVKEMMGFTKDSRILCVSTEGDTDQENYRRVVFEN